MVWQSIPVIDIGLLRSGTEEDWRRIGIELGEACQKIGFFYVINHGVPPQVIDDTFKSAEKFFSQHLEEKMKLSMEQNSRCFRGYSPVLSELADGKRNSYELMEFSVDLPPEDADVQAGKPMHGPNIWPNIPRFKDDITLYVEHQCALGFDLMKGIALSLGLQADYFYEAFEGRSFWQFRTLYYPEPEAVKNMYEQLPQEGMLAKIEVGDFNCGAHTDYGCLTILLSNSPGLQVMHHDGSWINAPVIPGAYICNIGDMLQYWTNNVFVATKHRVLTEGPRIALPFFFQPNYKTLVKPSDIAPSTMAEPIQYGPYAFEKYKGIYPNCRTM